MQCIFGCIFAEIALGNDLSESFLNVPASFKLDATWMNKKTCKQLKLVHAWFDLFVRQLRRCCLYSGPFVYCWMLIFTLENHMMTKGRCPPTWCLHWDVSPFQCDAHKHRSHQNTNIYYCQYGSVKRLANHGGFNCSQTQMQCWLSIYQAYPINQNSQWLSNKKVR